MPAKQRGQVDRVKRGQYRLRYYVGRQRRSKQPFPSKSAAWAWYRDNAEPEISGTARRSEMTLSEFVAIFLDRHAVKVRPRTISSLRERLGHAERQFGTITLRELERMVDEVAGWYSKQPDGVRYGRMQALRQALATAVRWGYMTENPATAVGQNPQPAARQVRVFTDAELEAIAEEYLRCTGRFPPSSQRRGCVLRSGKPSNGGM